MITETECNTCGENPAERNGLNYVGGRLYPHDDICVECHEMSILAACEDELFSQSVEGRHLSKDDIVFIENVLNRYDVHQKEGERLGLM